MRFSKALVPSIVCLLLVSASYAQSGKTLRTKSAYTRNRHNYRAPVVGHHKAKTICPIFENSKYPYQGVGFKMGDPFAFTYKLYPRKSFAFAIDVGKPSSGLYSKQFREEFQTKSAELLPGVAGIEYLTHKVKFDFVVEIKTLYQIDVDKLAKGLQFYLGAGWEIRNTKIDYDYLFQEEPSGSPNGSENNQFGNFSNNRFTQGAQGVVGFEYAYFQLPISAFMEMEYYVDVVNNPGSTHFQGGIGLRYVF